MPDHAGRFTFAVLLSAAATLLVGCSSDNAVTDPARPQFDADRTAVTFKVGRLKMLGMVQEFPDSRWHLRDIHLVGPVTGDLVGNAELLLNANLDTLLGAGPTFGTMVITASNGDVWEGAVTGRFANGFPRGIRLFANVSLRGPGTQVLKAQCDETSITSETLICTGQIL